MLHDGNMRRLSQPQSLPPLFDRLVCADFDCNIFQDSRSGPGAARARLRLKQSCHRLRCERDVYLRIVGLGEAAGRGGWGAGPLVA